MRAEGTSLLFRSGRPQRERSRGPNELCPLPSALFTSGAALDMVIDHPHCLHERINRGGADKTPPSLLEFLRHPNRGGRGRWHRPVAVALAFNLDWFKRPKPGGERTRLPGKIVDRIFP